MKPRMMPERESESSSTYTGGSTESLSSYYHTPSIRSLNNFVDGNGASGVGLSDSQHSQSSRMLLDLINKLHDTGVQSEIDLPQIAVIGSQSAGKSSLIESISGITLPRAAGTCTRCPTECRLSHSLNPWQCKVSLHRIVDGAGTPLAHPEDIPFGDVITDKTHVEDRIRRAQRAILCPERPFQEFLQDPLTENQRSPSQLNFSKNWVSLDISGPDVADLSFVDLPGLIAGGGDDKEMVGDLVSSYVKKESCVILVTVACETDFVNQGAYDLARQYDPQGLRTVGVLTKPDRIPGKEEDLWLPLLRNDTQSLANGWFCVKQPSTQELEQGLTWEGARKAEERFFTTKFPWSTLDDFIQSHLGTTKLVGILSSILSGLIKTRLPGIQLEIDRKLEATREALLDLGAPPSKDPQNEIMNMLYGFHREIARCVEGEPGGNGLLQQIRPFQDAFRQAIYRTAPNFSPYERRNEGGKGEEERGNAAANGVVNARSAPHPTQRNKAASTGEVIFIDDVMKVAKQARTRELPGSYPFYVQQQYIRNFVRQWEAPAQKLCEQVYKSTLTHMNALVHEQLGSYGNGFLEHRVGTLLREHIKKANKRSENKIAWLLSLEMQPFTLSQQSLLSHREGYKTSYAGSRAKNSNPAFVQALQNHQSSILSPLQSQPDMTTSTSSKSPQTLQPFSPLYRALAQALSGTNPPFPEH